MNSPTTPSDSFEPPPAETVPTNSKPEPEAEEDPVKKAEKVKETGNVAFKAGKYGEAIDLYTEAISEQAIFKITLPRH
jgi:DnaJ family protein C protein 7